MRQKATDDLMNAVLTNKGSSGRSNTMVSEKVLLPGSYDSMTIVGKML